MIMNTEKEIQGLFQDAISSLSEDYKGSSLTDLFVIIDEGCGEISIFDDEENIVAKGIITEWEHYDGENNPDYVNQLKSVITKMSKDGCFDKLDLYTPFSINLADEDFIVLEELLLIEDDSIIHLENDFLKRMDKEFDEFLDKLLKE